MSKYNIPGFLINACWVKNMSIFISDYITSNSFDILAITETWLSKSGDSKICLKELNPKEYKIFHTPRQSGKAGGGVAIVYRNTISARVCRVFHKVYTI